MGKEREELIREEQDLRSEICGVKEEDNDHIVIDEQLLKCNMFVEAGAGAGKTHTIVQRVLNQLCIGMQPSQIVVITFTKKAAEELRCRIAKDLKKRTGLEKFAEYRKNLKEALCHLDDMNISTIHSFCLRLLKERCFDAKLPVNITLLENDEEKAQKDLIFESYLAGLSEEEWDCLSGSDPNGQSRKEIGREIKNVYSVVCTTPKKRHVHIGDLTFDQTTKDDLFREFEKLIGDIVNEFADPPVSDFEDIFRLSDSLGDKTFLGSNLLQQDVIRHDDQGHMDYVRFWRAFLSIDSTEKKDEKKENSVYTVYYAAKKNVFVKTKCKLPGKTGKEKDEILERLVDKSVSFISDHIDLINEIMNEELVKYRSIVNRHAQKAKEYYTEVCSYSELTNDAILELTRDMVLESKEAQAYFAKKYLCYYVDEFQDTDRIQEAFIRRLASETDNPEELRDGALFIVGDPKQSIYRFRGAEPEVYLEVRKRMKEIEDRGGNVKVYNLKMNFRSNDLIIGWVNAKFRTNEGFKPIMTDRNGSVYQYQDMLTKNELPDEYKENLDENGYALKINPENRELLLAGVYKYDKPEKEGGSYIKDDESLKHAMEEREQKLKLEDPKKEQDMQDLCDLILNLHDNDRYRIMKEGRTERIDFSDFLVLCAAKTRMNSFLEYMSLRGIPVQISGDTEPKSILEMNAFVRIFKYLSDRGDPMNRVSAVEAIRCLKVTEKENELDEYAKKILDHVYEACRGRSPYAAALYLLRHLSVFLKKTKAYSSFEIKAIQTKIMQMAETVCRDNFGTLKDIADKFQEYIDRIVEHELSLEENTDAVRFMNIHKAKGLEGRIVIVTDRRGADPKVPHFWHEDEYYPRAKQYPKLCEKEREEEFSGKRRLEYVTATRAEQVLIFMDCQEKQKPLFHGEAGAKYGLDELSSIAPVILEGDPHMIKVSENAGYDLPGEEEAYEKEIIKAEPEDMIPDCQRISPSSFENGTSETKKRAAKKALDEGRSLKPDSRPVGNIFGTAMHRALELLVKRYKAISGNPDKTEEMISICVRQAVSENSEFLSEEEIGRYNGFLRAVLVSCYEKLKEEQLLDKASDIHTELKFSYYEGFGGEGEDQLQLANRYLPEDRKLQDAPVWMNGTADLVLRFRAGSPDESILIVDYKSDHDSYLTEEEFHAGVKEKYFGQLDNYRYAMRKIFGVPYERISMKIVSFSEKDEKGIPYKDGRVRVRTTVLQEQ